MRHDDFLYGPYQQAKAAAERRAQLEKVEFEIYEKDNRYMVVPSYWPVKPEDGWTKVETIAPPAVEE